MKRYPEHKDSGVEWIGKIPIQWEVVKLRFLCNITTGNKDTANSILDGEYPFYVRSPNIERIDSYSFDGEAILTAGDGVGAGKVFHYANGKFDYHQRVYNLHHFRNVYGKFLYYYMLENFHKEIERGNAKSTVDSIRLPMLQNFPIAVPDTQSQIDIVTYLDRKTAQIDGIISDKEKLIALLKEKRQVIISEAVTRGLDPTVPMKDSGVEWIGQIPAHWEMSRIGFEVWVRARLGWKGLKAEEYVENGFAFLSTPNIKSRDVDFDNVNFITQERYEESPEIKLKVGDVLLAKDGSTLGTVNVIRKLPCEATVNSSIAVITPNNNLHSVFLKYLFESYYLKNFIQMKKDGMGVPHLFQADIIKFPIPVPPIEEQNIIYQYLDQKTLELESLIATMEQQLALFREYRQSIISEAVTGKIMVAAPQSVVQSEQPAAKSGGANVHFKRRVLAAKILDKLCGEPTLGHVKLEKLLFLGEYCAELDMHTEYVRHAAGPYSPKTLRSIDTQLQKAKWFVYDKNNRGSKYSRLDKSAEYLPYFDANFSVAQSATVERLVELFRPLDTERCEIVATLYGAWNDFLIDGRSPTDEQIADEVLTHWSEEKKRIDKDRWLKAIGWMRKHQIVPCGYGEKTKRRDS